MHPMTYRILFPPEKRSQPEDEDRANVVRGLLAAAGAGGVGGAAGYYGADPLGRALSRLAARGAEARVSPGGTLAGSGLEGRVADTMRGYPTVKTQPRALSSEGLRNLLRTRAGRLGLGGLGLAGLGGLGYAIGD